MPTRRPSRSTARADASRTRSPAISGVSSPSARRIEGRLAEQLLRVVVDQRGAAVLVEDDDALAQRVQGRVVVGVERRDLLRLQAERLALEAPGEQQAERAADGQDQRREADQAGQQRRDLVADRVGEHADADQRDDLARVDHRDDRAHRAAERALRGLGDGPAARRRRVGADERLPIRLGVGCV